MSEQRFDLYFSGRILPQHDPETVKSRVGELFGVSGKALERLFTGTAVRIKQAVDEATAKRYQENFRKAGAHLELRYHDEVLDMDPEQAQTAVAWNSQPEAEAPATQTGKFDPGLAPVGSIMDDALAPPDLEVDTKDLSAAPPNSGSLEDCVYRKPAVPIPDISHMSLDDADS